MSELELPTGFPPGLAARYRPERVLGAGASGFVWKAVDRVLGREVALKVVKVLGRPAVGERVRREAEALAKVRSPHLVQVYAAGEEPEGSWVAMEYLEGPTLEKVTGPWNPVESMLEVASALESVHAAGIVHRDVKPANIVRTREGRSVLVDLGLARVPDRTRLTESGATVGSLGYLGPEVLSGGTAGAPADFYAWGVTLYQLVEGRLPFGQVELLLALQGDPLPAPEFQLVGPDSPLAKTILACMAADPAARPSTRRQLEDLLDGKSGREDQGEADPPGPAPAVEGRAFPRKLAGGLGGALLGLSLVGLWGWWDPLGKAGSREPPAASGLPIGEAPPGVPGPGPAGPTWIEFRGGPVFRSRNPTQGPPLSAQLGPFRLSDREVPVSDFARFLEATAWPAPPHWEEQLRAPERPVVWIDFRDAAAYAAWVGYRLPGIAEWELAARGIGPGEREYAWGDERPRPELANLWFGEDLPPPEAWSKLLSGVTAHPEGRSPEGVHGLEDNVREWCAGAGTRLDLAGLDPLEVRPVMGGSWRTPASNAPSAREGRELLGERRGDLGFRLAADPEEATGPGGRALRFRVEGTVLPAGTELLDLRRGVRLGKSGPGIDLELPPGSVWIRMEAPGHLPRTVFENAVPGGRFVLDAALEPRGSVPVAAPQPLPGSVPEERPGEELPDGPEVPGFDLSASRVSVLGGDLGAGGFLLGTVDGLVLRIEIGTGTELARARLGARVVALGPDPESRFVAVATADRRLRLLALPGLEALSSETRLAAGVTALSVAGPDGPVLVGTFPGGIEELAVPGMQLERRRELHQGPVRVLARGGPSGTWWSFGYDGKVQEFTPGREGEGLVASLGSEVAAVGPGGTVATADGRLLAVGAEGRVAELGRVELRAMAVGRHPETWALTSRGVEAPEGAEPGWGVARRTPEMGLAGRHPSELWIASGFRVRLVDLERRRPDPRSGRHPGPVVAVALHPDGRLLSAGYDGEVRAWAGSEETVRVREASGARPAAVGLSGTVLGEIGSDLRVGFRDLFGGESWGAPKERGSGASLLAGAPGIDLWATGSREGKVRIGPSRTSGVEVALDLEGGELGGLALARRGDRMVALRKRETALLVGLPTARALARLGDREDPPTAAAFSSDGRRLALGTSGGRILGYEFSSGERPELVLERRCHRDAVLALAFDGEGRRLASGGADGTLAITASR